MSFIEDERSSSPGYLSLYIWVTLFVGLAFVSVQAAERGVNQGGSRTEPHDTGSDVRVFSKDRPLFGRSHTIPNVTPDHSGKTRVEVIVKPDKPSRSQSVSGQVQSDRLSPYAPAQVEGGRQKPAEGQSRVDPPATANLSGQPKLVREGRQRNDAATPARSSDPTDVTGSSKVTGRPAVTPQQLTGAISNSDVGQTEVSGVLLPTANPTRLSGLQSAAKGRPLVEGRGSRAARLAGEADPARLVKSRSGRKLRRANVTKRRAPRARYPGMRQRRAPYWRRHAPPGTVHSFVRCWPGEPCVRYYRVRRPRTYRQYRRLLAWQRRQDVRLRYRRYYRRY